MCLTGNGKFAKMDLMRCIGARWWACRECFIRSLTVGQEAGERRTGEKGGAAAAGDNRSERNRRVRTSTRLRCC